LITAKVVILFDIPDEYLNNDDQVQAFCHLLPCVHAKAMPRSLYCYQFFGSHTGRGGAWE